MLTLAFAVVQVTKEDPDADEDQDEAKDATKEAGEDRGDGGRLGRRGTGVRRDGRSAGQVSAMRMRQKVRVGEWWDSLRREAATGGRGSSVGGNPLSVPAQHSIRARKKHRTERGKTSERGWRVPRRMHGRTWVSYGQ